MPHSTPLPDANGAGAKHPPGGVPGWLKILSAVAVVAAVAFVAAFGI
jgi:hypothetical protein